MLQTDSQWQDHKNDVHIKDYKKEASEEVEDFGKEIPALILKRIRLVKLYLGSNYTFLRLTITHQYLVINLSL